MRAIRYLFLFFVGSTIAQNGLFTNIQWSTKLKPILNKAETHCLLWNGSSYGLIYDLTTGEQVKEVILTGFTKSSSFEALVFDYRNDKAIIAGWDNSELKPDHYFLWDEASNSFFPGNNFAKPNHGKIIDLIGDEIVFCFTIYKKDSKGRLDLDKPEHSFVQFYNWKTKKWRETKYDYEFAVAIPSKNLLGFKEKNKIKYLDINTLSFLDTTTDSYDNIITHYQDGKVYAAKYNKGIDKVALLDEKTLTTGKFSKPPSTNNLDYYWGALWKYQIQLLKTENKSLNAQDVDLVITNKQTKEEKKARITAGSKEEVALLRDRVETIKNARLNQTKNDLAKKYAGQTADFKEWEINFQDLPKSYVHNYQNAKGRDITNLKMSRRLFLTPNTTVYAIGRIFQCEESKTFLVMLRGPQAEGTESVYAVLKTDHYGNRLQYQIVARTLSNNLGYIQMDDFSISTYLNNNTTIDVTENYMGEKKKKQYKIYCLN
ncbi:hypothetical protein SLW70_06675 [Flavobacterium sp. NG2]|uniref:hypothetical protein n=1 Tax=Flavobacterium sp. NG2 TaxID=3097547 RepID=UPI002A801E02|nr:hypothetical protein [Flavobacterium sp. NG2]WPR72806.1 hypothetical protein SLW70_06675 [Flavobacterium sp. NG2]